jgi:putative Holliday junction resolvase
MPQPGCVDSETKFPAVPTRGDDPPEPPGGGVLRSGNRLAVDVGSVRIGIASCDPAGILATPLTTISRGRGDLAAIARLCAERKVFEVVVGLPTGLSGQAGKAAEQARAFATKLAALIAPVQVRLVDERFTTTLAHSALRDAGQDARKRRGTVDRAAATFLLQSALDAERLTGDPAGELVGAVPAKSGGGR